MSCHLHQLSITEYRKRHKNASGGEDGCGGCAAGEEGCEWSRGSSASLSPQRLDAAAAAAVDDLEQRLHRDLAVQMPKGESNINIPIVLVHHLIFTRTQYT